MHKINIVILKYYNFNEQRYVIGGVETYIQNLSRIFADNGFIVNVFQRSDTEFKVTDGKVNIYGIKQNTSRKIVNSMCNYVNEDYENDIILFSTDYDIVKNKYKKCVAIQHGITWDITSLDKKTDLYNYVNYFADAVRCIKKYNRFKKCNYLVCVDYNFLNWYRSQTKYINNYMRVIPNFARTLSNNSTWNSGENVSIIFARRLYEFRGTRIFTNAIIKILSKYPNIKITIAGEGPDEGWMKDRLKDYSQVQFIKYKADQSQLIHSKHDIAVVPTRGSEGTSLSLLEAMASGCTVISTNVGGITNILIDGYNGLIVNPDVESLYIGIEKLIVNENLRAQLRQKSIETVEYAFNYKTWKDKWLKLITEIDSAKQ